MDIINRYFSIFSNTTKNHIKRFASTGICIAFVTLTSQTSSAALVAINEFHYDNTGADTNEGVELIGISGTNLNNWSIVLYNGTDQSPYKTVDLSSVTSTTEAAFSFWHISISGMQNGSNDGIALIDDTNVVQDFISYEGSLTALNGPAKGLSSIDVIVNENATTPVNFSLQRTGSVTINGASLEFGDANWEAGDNTWGAVNQNQNLNQAAVPLPGALWLMLTALSFTGLGKRQLKAKSI